jgi:hypothetical protein
MLHNKSVFYFLLVLAGIYFYSCEETTDETTLESPFEYYPFQTGKFIVYEVDSINYHETIPNDTSTWQVKELLIDTFYDLEQRLNYRIERYRRLDVTADWELTNVWNVLATNGQIQKVENNLRFIKLATPVWFETTWDGNVYLGGLEDIPVAEECNELTFYEDWQYSYANINAPYSVNGLNFDNTITVIQEGDSNLIWYDYAEEIYALGVGLIQKDFYHYYTQDLSCPECPWNQRVQCGFSLSMRVLDYN